MITDDQKEAAYLCSISELLKAAYGREFGMLECGKCKTTFRTVHDWYGSLNDEQSLRVDAYFEKCFNQKPLGTCES